MRQRLILSQQQQMLNDVCDFGIEPRPDTTMTLDFIIYDDWVQPVVHFRNNEEQEIRLHAGFTLKWLEERRCSVSQLQKEATVMLALEEDPASTTIHIFIAYKGVVLEHIIDAKDVRKFLFLPYYAAQDIPLTDEECCDLLTFADYEPKTLAA